LSTKVFIINDEGFELSVEKPEFYEIPEGKNEE